MTPRLVTVLGDSITAGYGLRPGEALPPQLEKSLLRAGTSVRVIGAGVSGDTIRDGLARLDRDVPARTDLCVVALGANDLMQSVSPDRVRADLDTLLKRLRDRSIPALLCGMRAPPWLVRYAPRFDAAFAAAARSAAAPLYPFLLQDVALVPELNLPDRIHPNARGIALIARNLTPAVQAALGAAEPSAGRRLDD